MRQSVPRGVASSQPMDIDRATEGRSTPVDQQSLAALRQVVCDLGYTLDALEAAMGKDRSFVNKVLNGEKPMPPDFIDALPDDVKAEWHGRRAQSLGRFVVTPASDDHAVQHFISGLLALLRPQLPVRATQMAKASISAATARKAVP